MFRLKHVILATLVGSAGLVAAPHVAAGALTPAGAVPAVPAVLQMAQTQGGLQIIKDFQAVGGLHGWVVKDKSSQPAIVFTTADGSVLLAGMAMDTEGRNLTNVYATEHLPQPDYSPAFKAFAPGGTASGVTVGSAKAPAEITVLFDANCGYCKLMHKLVQPAIDAGELRVHYVPVAILSADSAPKGAGVLATKDAKGALDRIANGGPAELAHDKDLLAKVQANTGLMPQHGFNGTPAVLYKVRKGKDETLVVSPGLPAMASMFKALGISGQMEKLKADPALTQYLN